jgi:ribose transport system substrate-binding protein
MIVGLTVIVMSSSCAGSGVKAPYQLTVILQDTTSSDFWHSVRQGIEAAGEEMQVEFTFISPGLGNARVSLEMDNMESAIIDESDAILLATADYEGFSDFIERADQRDIPVITIHTEAEARQYPIHVSTNPRQSVGLLVEALESKITHGLIAVITTSTPDQTYVQRQEMLIEGIRNIPSLEVSEIVVTNGEKVSVMQQVKLLLQNRTDIKGIVGICKGCVIGSSLAVRDLALKEKITVMGFESSPSEVQLLEEGLLDSIVVQNPFAMGYFSVKAAIDKLIGNKVEPRIYIQSILITKESLQLPEIQKLLYPFDSP